MTELKSFCSENRPLILFEVVFTLLLVMRVYDTVYEIVRAIPPGYVMTYGQIAEMVSGCTARMVGYALAALPETHDVPWWRVVNSQLKISLRQATTHHLLQRELLEQEGVVFDRFGKIENNRHFFSKND